MRDPSSQQVMFRFLIDLLDPAGPYEGLNGS